MIVADAGNHLEYNMEDWENIIKDVMSKSFAIDRSRLVDEAELGKDLGIDSLTVAEMVMVLEDTIKLEILGKESIRFVTVGEAVSVLKGLIEAKQSQGLPS